MKSCQIGFDVGGTGLKAALIQGARLLSSVTAETPAQEHPETGIEVMAELIQMLKREAAQNQLTIGAVGVGLAGLIDAPNGTVITAPNLPKWENVPLVEKLSERIELPVAVDNDVRTMAMGELRYGAGQGAHNMLCLTVGTGVGSAIIINGQIYRGSSLSAGEFGHVPVIYQGGRNCGCGSRGCLETVAGTEGILSLAQQYIDKGLAPQLEAKSQHQKLTPRLIFDAAQAGDAGAQSVFQELGHWLGLALAGAVNFINPEKIVIGGGIAQAGDLLFQPVLKAIRSHAFQRPVEALELLPAQLGAEAGMIGAAAMAKEISA